MGMVKSPDTMTVVVTLRIEVDPHRWAENYGLLDPTHTRGYSPAAVRDDIRTAITSQVIGLPMIEESDATVSGICPDVPPAQIHQEDDIHSDVPPTLVRQEDGTYIRVEHGMSITAEIDYDTTYLHIGTQDGDVLITTDGDVFRAEAQGIYTQRQGPCIYDRGHGTCGQPGQEVVNRYGLELHDEYETMILCPACTRDMIESI